jgi:subtilisin family serine protease
MYSSGLGNLNNKSSPISANSLDPLDLVKLKGLMRLSRGSPKIRVGLIDGPVALDHPDLGRENIHVIPGKLSGACALASSAACMHGTFVAGILSAKRTSQAPGICPECTLLVRPIFEETTPGTGQMPRATPENLADAIVDCVNAGAHVINLSVALATTSSDGSKEKLELTGALNLAGMRGLSIVAASGNQAIIGSSVLTSHPAVIPVVAFDTRGSLISQSNIGISIGRRGLAAPGENITGLGASGGLTTLAGTSAATPFVTGAIALLLSLFPNAKPFLVRLALMRSRTRRPTTVVPELMDAWRAYEAMKTNLGRLII